MKARLLYVLTLSLSCSMTSLARADGTAVGIADGSVSAGGEPTSLEFPVTRIGDTSFDVYVQPRTVDGTAVAGADYTAAVGAVRIPGGSAAATIPVSVAAAGSPGGLDKTFQLILDDVTGVGPAALLGPQQTFATRLLPSDLDLAQADFNGDGRPDLIVATIRQRRISVLTNTTTTGSAISSFAARDIGVGAYPSSVEVTDVNGDGKPDLILTLFRPDSVSVLLNITVPGASVPRFSPLQPLQTSAGVNGRVESADINMDGKADLVIGNRFDVWTHLNQTGTGASVVSFSDRQGILRPEDEAGDFAVGDIDGDGKSDVIIGVVSDEAFGLSVFRNRTMPNAASVSFSEGPVVARIGAFGVSDLNSDGRLDLFGIGFDFGTQDTAISVLVNTSQAGSNTLSFGEERFFPAPRFAIAIAAADLNGDGKPDLIVGDDQFQSGTLLNVTSPVSATARFAPYQGFEAGLDVRSLATPDVNGDGKADVVAGNSDGTVSVLLNATPAPATSFTADSFGPSQAFVTGTAPSSVSVADINRDGRVDLLLANAGSNTVSALLNTTAPGADLPGFAVQRLFAVGSRPVATATADFDLDGRADLVSANRDSNDLSLRLNTTPAGLAAARFGDELRLPTGTAPVGVVADDTNGDGRADLLVANRDSNSVSVRINNTVPGAIAPDFAAPQSFAAGLAPSALSTAEVNGDGRPDLIVANGGADTVSVLLNTAAAGAAPAYAAGRSFPAGSAPSGLAAADLNGDGRADLVVANAGSGSMSVLFNRTPPGAATPAYSARRSFAAGATPQGVSTVDVDGDGRLDLLVASRDEGRLSVLLNITAAGAQIPGFAAAQPFAAGNAPVAVAAADIDGDGRPDLIAASSGSNRASVLLNNQYRVQLGDAEATGTIRFPPDTTPAPFTFTDLNSADSGAAYFSNVVTVSGLNAPAPVTLSGYVNALYRINAGPLTREAGTVVNGDTLRIRLAAAADTTVSGQTRSATLAVDGVSDTWSVRIIDRRPAVFVLAGRSNATPGTLVMSDAVRIRGINAPAPITVSGDAGFSYRINAEPWTDTPGTVNDGDALRLRVRAAATQDTRTQVTVSVGGVVETFAVMTAP